MQMPDLLTHVLIAYTVCLLFSWRYDWITAPYLTTGMVGAFIPDLSKMDILISSGRIQQFLGLPFEWFGLHTGGPVFVSILIGVIAVVPRERKRVFLLLTVGAITHFLADGLLRTATGRSFPMLWPLTRYRPPTPGLYLSTQIEPTLAAIIIALGTYVATRYYRNLM